MEKFISETIIMDYTFEEISQRIKIGISIFFINDIFLLKNNAHERSISHKLAEYLQQLFPDWNVDCEYNRRLSDTKELRNISDCSQKKSTDSILPDIIIHQRNEEINNLLVIEIKKDIRESKCDIKKLELFTSENGEYKYKFGLFLQFNKFKEPVLTWFKNGKKCLDKNNPK